MAEVVHSNKPQSRYPFEPFVQLIMRRWKDAPDRSRIRCLDLGCGVGANSQFLAEQGFRVTALDIDLDNLGVLERRIKSTLIEPIEANLCNWIDWEARQKYYDCILDHETLCHVTNPPYRWIYDALKPGGVFYTRAPRDDCWQGVAEGKKFTRFAKRDQILGLMHSGGFTKIDLDELTYTYRGRKYASWLVEAHK